MTKTIRSIAGCCAIAIFFVMSLVGWLFKCSPATCCNRALMGEVITYVAVSWAGTIVYRLLLNAMIESRVRKAAGGNRK